MVIAIDLLVKDWVQEQKETLISGNASRYFKSIIYTSKASPSERQEVNNHHPTVKPIKLMEYLVNMITPPNGIVLDPFAGSFTTGVACQNTGRHFIGIELDKEYYNKGKERMDFNRKLFPV